MDRPPEYLPIVVGGISGCGVDSASNVKHVGGDREVLLPGRAGGSLGVHRGEAWEESVLRFWSAGVIAVVFGVLSAGSARADSVSVTSISAYEHTFDASTGVFTYTGGRWSSLTGAAPTVDVDYGSTSWFHLTGGWGVDTPYMRWGLRVTGLPEDAYIAYPNLPTTHGHVVDPVVTGDFLYQGSYARVWPVNTDEYVHSTVHGNGSGFMFGPAPGVSFTSPFSVMVWAGTARMDSGGGFGASIAYGATYTFNVGAPPVPEPGTLALMGLGATALIGVRRGRRVA